MVLFSRALLVLPSLCLAAKFSDQNNRRVTVDVDGSVYGSPGEGDEETAALPSFKAMSWNILAEGLSMDGFAVPLDAPPKKQETNKYDQALKAENVYAALTADTEVGTPNYNKDATLAEYITDSEALSEHVMPAVEKEAKAMCKAALKLGELGVMDAGCCPAKDLMKQVANYTVNFALPKGFTDTNEDKMSDELMIEKVTYQGNKCVNVTKPDGEQVALKKTTEFDTEKAKNFKKLHESYAALRNKYMNIVKHMNDKWDLGQFTAVLTKTIEWGSTITQESGDAEYTNNGRGSRIVAVIKEKKPDILALQENDHYRFFQDQLAAVGLVTTTSKGLKYDHKKDCSKKKPTDEELAVCVADRKFARTTKYKSNAMKFSIKKDADNDGATLFWSEKRFEALSIVKLFFNEVFGMPVGSDGGVVGVHLKDKETEKCLFVMTTHLAAGVKSAEEKERVAQLGPEFKKWVEAQQEESRKHPDCEKSGAHGPGTLLLMDGNTYQNFAVEADDVKRAETVGEISVERNMYHSDLLPLGLNNFVLPKEQTDAEAVMADTVIDKRKDLPKSIAYSVNKIRGIHSVQLAKVGDYQLDRIDYMAGSKHFKPIEVDSLPLIDRSADRKGPQSPYNALIPSMSNPSDHLPLVAEIHYSDDAKVWGEPAKGEPAKGSQSGATTASATAAIVLGAALAMFAFMQ